ncbi:MAG: methyltransferase domain-containing protein [Candidatus Woesearchaeota archaeon]
MDKTERIRELVQMGKNPSEIIATLKDEGMQCSIAEVELEVIRRKAVKKHPEAYKMFLTEEALRFATPKEVGEYRASRIAASGSLSIADLCCGIGFQTIEFAKRFEKVYAVELDAEKIKLAKMNADALGIRNIEFIRADIFDSSLFEKIKGVDAIFCDPSRSPSAAERRLESIPEIGRILSEYSKITDRICIEAPPQIGPERISLECEAEYVSLNWSLNRLNLYFGSLKRCSRSAVLLPQGNYLQNRELKVLLKNVENSSYAYEVNPAVRKAGLVVEALPENIEVGKLYEDKKLMLLGSREPFESPYLRRYKIVESCTNSPKEINRKLKLLGAGRALLRGRIPAEDYWIVRREMEKGLSGSAAFQVFITADRALICREF